MEPVTIYHTQKHHNHGLFCVKVFFMELAVLYYLQDPGINVIPQNNIHKDHWNKSQWLVEYRVFQIHHNNYYDS